MKKNFTRYLLMILLFVIYIDSNHIYSASSTISGTIIDTETKHPIEYVNLVVKGTTIGTVSNEYGQFSLKLNPGTYQLRCLHIGYEKKEIIITAPQNEILDIELKSKPYQAPGVMVSSTVYKPDSLFMKYNLNYESLLNVPALGEPDPTRAVTLLPGVIATNDLKGEFHVRGGSADENLIFLDGVEITNPYHLLGLVGTFNLDAINHIEFYPGLLPPHYGDRLSSALLLQSQADKFCEQSRIRVSLLASSLTFRRQWKSGNIMLSLRRTYFDLLLKLFHKLLGYNFYDGHFHVTQQLSPSWNMELTSFFHNDYINPRKNDQLEAEQMQDSSNVANSVESDDNWGNCLISLRLNRVSRRSLLRFQTALSHHYNTFEGMDNNVLIEDTFNSFIQQVDCEREFEKVTFGSGIFYKYHQYDYYWYEAGFPNDLEEILYEGVPAEFTYNKVQTIAGGYANVRTPVNRKLTVNLGLRMVANDQNRTYMLPRIALEMKLPASFQFCAGIGRNVQYHAYGEDGVESTIGSPTFPQFLPLQSEIYSLKIERGMPFSTHVQVEMYRKQLRRVVRLGKGTFPDFESGTGKAHGFDLLIIKGNGRLSYQFGYSYMVSIYRFADGKYYPDWDIRHAFKGLFGFQFGRGWALNYGVQAQSGVPYTPFDAYIPIWSIGSDPNDPFRWISVHGKKNSVRSDYYLRTDLLFRKTWIGRERTYSFYVQVLNLLARGNNIRVDKYGNVHNGIPVLPTMGFTVDF